MRLTGAELLEHCLGRPGAWQDEPWDGNVVAKVSDKIFAFLGGGGESVGIKCGSNRQEADELIASYPDDVSVMAYIEIPSPAKLNLTTQASYSCRPA
jgi:predicted DNA-binding protein (MmcQ/YjbR family)